MHYPLPHFSPFKTQAYKSLKMAYHENGGLPDHHNWPRPDLLHSEVVRKLHETIENDWDLVKRSACQTAAGRALWKHVVHDPLAELFAGETYLKNLYEKIKKERLNNSREVSGVILAVRTLWFESKLEAAVKSFGGRAQVVLLGAGMDTRAYRLDYLKESDVYEMDFPEVLQMKETLLQAAMESINEHNQPMLTANSLCRVAADIRDDDWFKKLQASGFMPEKNTVWILEGILYYLPHSQAMGVLKTIADSCNLTQTVLLADFMNKQSTTLSSSTFHFYSDWPDHLLPSLGFLMSSFHKLVTLMLIMVFFMIHLICLTNCVACPGLFKTTQMMDLHVVACIWCRLLVHPPKLFQKLARHEQEMYFIIIRI